MQLRELFVTRDVSALMEETHSKGEELRRSMGAFGLTALGVGVATSPTGWYGARGYWAGRSSMPWPICDRKMQMFWSAARAAMARHIEYSWAASPRDCSGPDSHRLGHQVG